MNAEKKKNDEAYCPVGRFFQDLERSLGRDSKFCEHLNRSRIEFLTAVKTLIEDRIENLEKRTERKGRKKIDKIKVD